ncbi:MAG: purine-binding chemotaxis protein CheW, partial [Armatimonadetes bacterium]|nr:purine-binding chemotaxis protein CheW [Armatimonadota bacterium]
ALTVVAEAPPYLAGLLNYRGAIIPIFDLGCRLGLARRRPSLTDTVVVLNPDAATISAWPRCGLIVDHVRDVVELSPDEIEPPPAFDGVGRTRARFIAGVASSAECLVQLLDLGQTLAPPAGTELIPVTETEGPGGPSELVRTAAWEEAAAADGHIAPEERAIFRERALNLMRVAEAEDHLDLTPYAVLDLGGEYFGVPLEHVREFTPFPPPTPIPCCPPIILGALNLRGQILPLVDLRPSLHLPTGPIGPEAKVVVITLNDWLLGAPVDAVCDVIYLRPGAISAAPALRAGAGGEYVRGTAPYADRMLAILDLGRLFAEQSLVVDEVP